MKSKICMTILFLCLTFLMEAQNKYPTKIHWSRLVDYSFSFYKISFIAVKLTSAPIKQPSSLNYQAEKLPFFCSLEDKSRNRFNIYLKFRAGNDESYRKMIQSGTRLRD